MDLGETYGSGRITGLIANAPRETTHMLRRQSLVNLKATSTVSVESTNAYLIFEEEVMFNKSLKQQHLRTVDIFTFRKSACVPGPPNST
jgi:hypothetical protein